MSPAPRPGGADAGLTWVELTWRAGEVEQWIRFGQSCDEQVLSRQVRRLGFAPGALFALVRWASNDVGTIASHLDILRAARAGEAITTASGVEPGGESLLRLSGWPKVKAALAAIDAIEAMGLQPADVAWAHWRQVHHRLSAGVAHRPYTLMRHRAWRARQAVGL
jgi:hypothetical protein